MERDSHNEREMTAILRSLDFSRCSVVHKNQLWRSLCSQSEEHLLQDGELDAVAGGTEQRPEDFEKNL